MPSRHEHDGVKASVDESRYLGTVVERGMVLVMAHPSLCSWQAQWRWDSEREWCKLLAISQPIENLSASATVSLRWDRRGEACSRLCCGVLDRLCCFQLGGLGCHMEFRERWEAAAGGVAAHESVPCPSRAERTASGFRRDTSQPAALQNNLGRRFIGYADARCRVGMQ
jgi:hypothetical protein